MILRDRDTNADGTMDQRHYVQHDANFNVTAITDPTGTVAQRYLYDPYGQATVLDANWQPTTGNHAWQYLHQGGRYDPATTLHHFRHRDYSAELGRWVQQDPLGYVDGTNLSEVAHSSPLSTVDPHGLEARSIGDLYIEVLRLQEQAQRYRDEASELEDWGRREDAAYLRDHAERLDIQAAHLRQSLDEKGQHPSTGKPCCARWVPGWQYWSYGSQLECIQGEFLKYSIEAKLKFMNLGITFVDRLLWVHARKVANVTYRTTPWGIPMLGHNLGNAMQAISACSGSVCTSWGTFDSCGNCTS